MPVNLSIKNVPDALAGKLRARAQRNHRSLQRELMSILELAARQDEDSSAPGTAAPPQSRNAAAARLSIEELAERARRLFPKGTPSSVELIREQRDGRFGERWAQRGRDPGRR